MKATRRVANYVRDLRHSLSWRQSNVDRDILATMNRQIVHRGPDDDGFFVEGNVGLAMRRLSIIDVKTGHQPLSNEDENLWIVFNGEIYNHGNCEPSWKLRGHRYRTRSDTETIVHFMKSMAVIV